MVGLTINGTSGQPITGDTSLFAIAKLSIYNGACRFVGETRLATLTDNVPIRYLLDDVWNTNGVVSCLEMGQWNFAKRTSKLDYDSTIVPNFGYSNAFAKPGDWVRTMGVCSDDRFNIPLTRYSDEAGYIFSDLRTIYFAYVSSDPNYGGNLGLWPPSFTEAVQGYFGLQIMPNLTAASEPKLVAAGKRLEELFKIAKNRDAMSEGTKFLPRGSWASARLGGWNRGDGGGNTSLFG